MLLTPHTVAGIAIGAAVSNPVLAIPAAFFSHFLLDFLPHWDEIGLGRLAEHFQRIPRRSFRIILLDALISLSFVLTFLYWAMPDYGVAVRIIACSLAANLMDIFYIPLVFFKKRWGWVMWAIKLQSWIQTRSRAPLLFGISIQLFAIAVGSLIARQEILIRLPQTWSVL